METKSVFQINKDGLGSLINRIQTLFVGILRIWSIPIVLMLSVTAGFTTYYGLSHFIIPWIALAITIAVQSVIVICSLEIAALHWRANRLRYLSVLVSLVVAISASVTFSYFRFYEISQSENIHISRLNKVRQEVNDYLTAIVFARSGILKQQNSELEKATAEASQAYFGTLPHVPAAYKNLVGEGHFWKHYNQLYQTKKDKFDQLDRGFHLLDEDIRKLQTSLNHLETDLKNNYPLVVAGLQEVQLRFNQLATSVGNTIPQAPVLMTYGQFIQGLTPSFSMWTGFSPFAFACAALVDFFTVLLSYRLEFTAPGPLSEHEQELVLECLRQFSEFRINENDELEMVIEKSEIERARRYSDWSRMFAVGFLLSRGFLRKIDKRSVEFAPNLYPLIADRMGAKLRAIKTRSQSASSSENNPLAHEQQ
ncbi:conserved membrane hypothetical protein [Candidatus Methylobacter favarea]|uniref:Uncharacterized protein n=1 Tax=Candidatus Methylobacter favarea TaxID=2707345 RepID=A0A8S0XSQ2_9GAMM|nr:hypothetical protein [Candidatus Methylobacter favarea]CAA9890952.1 conserved membrane hypothetical protein [Candidatus Methylobacter favarea]